MEVNQTTYENLKRSVSGFYFKFNTQVLKWHMSKIWDYEYLLETAKSFSTFTEFYIFHTRNKQELIEKHILMMYSEAQQKGMKCQPQLVRDCVIVRLGNVYNGMYTENNILNTFQNLSPYITCKKTNKEIDTLYKVDGIVELAGVDKLAIQIKPKSFLSYDKGSELPHHKQFEKEYGMKVHYVFYLNRNTITFNNKTIDLKDKNKIINEIEKIILARG